MCAGGLVCAVVRLADDTLLASAEYLEGVATVQVDGGAAPDFGVLTLAAAEYVQGLAQYVHTLLAQDDTAVALGNLVRFIRIVYGFAIVVFIHLVEELLALNNGAVQVDDYVTVDDAAGIAATVDVATLEAAGEVVFVAGSVILSSIFV